MPHEHFKGDGSIITEYRTLVCYQTELDEWTDLIFRRTGWMQFKNHCAVQTPCTVQAVDLVFTYRRGAIIAGPLGIICCN